MTIHDIAKMAGVSSGTVSNVLNHSVKVAPETEERVRSVIKKAGYVPNRIAQDLKRNNTRNIFVIVEDVSAFPSPMIIDGITEYCYGQGYNITLLNLRILPRVNGFQYEDYAQEEQYEKDLGKAFEQAKSINASGIIYSSIYPRNIENIMPETDIPVVYCYSYSSKGHYCVNCNDLKGGEMATEYLIARGHKKIALICGVFDSVPTYKRLLGYQTVLMKHQIPFVPQYVVNGEHWSYEDGYKACQQLLSLSDPPTAIFAMSDVMAVGAIHAAMDMGFKVPEDISVHGYDRIENIWLHRPTLATVAMPLKEIGRKGGELLIRLIDQQDIAENSILVDCTHIEGDSVSPICEEREKNG